MFRFSIRRMLLVVTLLAVPCACFAAAYQGSFIGMGLGLGLVGVIIPIFVCGVFHQVGLVLAKLTHDDSGNSIQSEEHPKSVVESQVGLSESKLFDEVEP